nr:unnamed protein product [Callosobruchus chinensis]
MELLANTRLANLCTSYADVVIYSLDCCVRFVQLTIQQLCQVCTSKAQLQCRCYLTTVTYI